MDQIKVLQFLKLHKKAYEQMVAFASETGHPAPQDTRSWSQILVSLVTDIKGLERKKGADLADGSDVKGANTWGAIDTPRFNGVIKSGTKSEKAGKMAYLDSLPHLFFVLWDHKPNSGPERCRIWVVNPPTDALFRKMCSQWYDQRVSGDITSDNFQLHPPRNKDHNTFRNTCGNLNYSLLFEAIWNSEMDAYEITAYNACAVDDCKCSAAEEIIPKNLNLL